MSIYRIGDKSLEFCGGPHVHNTSDLGRFKIVKEQSVGSGCGGSGPSSNQRRGIRGQHVQDRVHEPGLGGPSA